MKIINLSKGFTPISGDYLDYKLSFFSGGEPNIKIDSFVDNSVTITTRINNANDLLTLCCAADSLRRICPSVKLSVFIPYFPAARQDRVCNFGEALTSKVYADIINNLNFEFVSVLDPHSDVSPALIDNCESISPYNIWAKELPINKSDIIAIPDFGATKATEKWVNGRFDFVQCRKKRDSNGKLVDFNVFSSDLNGRDVWVLDDICDGGGTFIGLAKKLKELNCGNINLFVTHGIFSKGLGHIMNHIDNVYTTDSWSNYEQELRSYSNFKVIKIKK